jgi:UDP-3-O-[3-hydroxymyristoyl] N-acetylglucosamine deacetylase
MDDFHVLNAGGLRSKDEFVKHKMLDAMGDLYVLGNPLIAHYSAFKSGHEINNKLLRELLAHEDAYEIVTYEAGGAVPQAFTTALQFQPG